MTEATTSQETIKAALARLRADVEQIECADRALLDLALSKLKDAGYAIDAFYAVQLGAQAAAGHDDRYAADAAPLDPAALGQ
ncbi:MAG: hypothetical protein NT113_10405 [Hyphomicrobiales bacterium]|jgi:hypothetical protein|nr:hypothetical protein [Hyphomicrobiales bacterium]